MASHRTAAATGLALLLLLLPLAAALAPADTPTPPTTPEKPCCAPLAALQQPLQIPVLLFTLPSPLPEKRAAEVVGRMCQCGPTWADDENANGPDPAAAAAPAPPDTNDDEQIVWIKIRGSTSARDYSKKSFNLNAAANSTELSLLGMPRDEKWALLGVQDDRTLGTRTALPFNAYLRGFDRWAPRTRLAEVYVRVEGAGGPTTPSPPPALDYRGVYVASERITRGKKRVNVTRFDPSSPPSSSSFMLSYENDNVRPGEPLVSTKMSRLAWVIEYPSAELLANASAQALKSGGKKTDDPIAFLASFFDGMERALLAPGPLVEEVVNTPPALSTTAATATTTFVAALPSLAPFLDAQGALDYFLLTELTKNPDGYRGSVKMHKNASTPLVMGPPWDYGEAFGSCCGFPIEGYKTAGRSGPGTSGGSAISPQGWRFNVCADPGRCVVEPADGTSQWFRRLWQDGAFRAGAAARWRQLRQGALNDTFFVAAIDESERRLVSSGAAARNYARWSAEMPPKAEEMVVLERNGLGLGLGGGGGGAEVAASGAGAGAGAGAVAAAAPPPPPPPPAQFTAANLFLKQWVLARLRWMDQALAAVADPASPPDAYLAVKA